MTTQDRTPAIIACMLDLAEHAVDRLTPSGADSAKAVLAASALNLAHDGVAAFALWPLSGADEMIADGLWRFLRGEAPRFTSIDDATRAQRVALRFATVAIAAAPGLGDPPPEVRWLWEAAGRLANLRAEPRGFTVPTLSVQVGDIIDAKDVPPGTLVDRQAPDGPLMTIRLPSGRGYHIIPDGPGGACWVWPPQTRLPMRVLATGLRGAEADRVAMMTPAEVREWLAQRVASPVGERRRLRVLSTEPTVATCTGATATHVAWESDDGASGTFDLGAWRSAPMA